MNEDIDQQRARFQAALNRTGFDLMSVSPKLSEATGNVIMSLSHFEQLVGPRQLTALQPIARAADDGVALILDDRTVVLTHAQTIQLCRAIVEALGGFERLRSR